ncbi:MAG TPA: glycosyltransferase, partial [Gammaproteobacteria bacterium]|nr:glycosyltransferase [Gammaproteobacteria bacterium]
MNNKALQYSPRISVVIVTYNFAAYLRECIESILAQTLRPFEIVIYDDCSNDESWDIITEYRDRYPDQFVVHRQENNVGMHRNVNDALRRARGELVSCLDGDDRWLPRKLEAEWNAICRNPGARAAYSNVFSVTPQGERVAVWHDGKGQEPPSGDVFVEVFSKRFFPGMRSIFRNPLMFRSDLEVLAYHDEEIELYIDWDLKIRLAAAVPVVYSGEALVDYRIHEGGIHNLPLDTHMRDLVRIYRKNRHLLEQRTEAEQAFIESEIESLAREYGGSMEAVIGETKPSAGAAEAFGGGRTQPEAACVSSGEELVFLVSLPRSGSTVLQRVLAGHPEVHSTAEPWLMLHPLYALKTAGIEAEYDARLARQALGEFLDTIPGGEENYYEGVRAMASVLYRRALKTSGKRLFLDKTPRYFYILPELAKTFPKAKFVLLLRNPVAVMSSMLRTWFGNDTRTLRAHRHYRDLTEGVRLLAEAIPLLGERAICVHYEDLIADAEHTVRTVCAHLGIRFSAEMLNYGRGRPPAGSFGDSRSVHRHDSVVGDYVDTWREHLSTGETRQFALEYLDEMDDGVMAVLGYSKAGLVSALNGGADGGVRTAEVRTAAETARPAGRGALVEELNSRGEEAFRKGDIDTASAAFEAAYAMDGSDPEVLNNLLVVRWQMGEEEQALHYLAQALDRDPFYRDTVINGGQILAALGEGAKAADLYDAYLTVHSDEEIRGLRAALESGTAGHAQGMEREGVSGEDNGILVSAIVSTYNSEDLIEGCLQDLLAQTIADRIEIIVIDSASEQNERDIVERYQRQHSCIRYVRTPQRETIYAAWNRAIGMARGRYLTNANTDDRHRPDALERMARVLDEHPDVSLVYANCAVTAVPNCTFHDAPVQGYFRWPEHDARHLFSVCYVGPQPMWRRSLHDRYGAFDADMRVAGDYEFWLRLAPHEKFLHVPEDLGLYLCSADSVQHKYAEEAARETLLARQRNWPASWGAMPTPGRNYLVPVVGGSKENDGGDAPTLVSIIMPTKDRPELLPRAVDSVLSQSYTSWELIVVNDGGVGIEGSLGERLRDSRIRCVSLQRSVGQAAARNIALQEANGEIICYLDDDDAYLEDHLRTVVGVLANGDRAFAYTDAVVVPEEFAGGVLREVGERSNPYAHESYSRDRLLVNNYIPINTWAHRRSCLDEIGLFDESLTCYEDWEFLLRLSARHEFMHVPSTTVEVRFRVDREDNVTRRRLADTEAAYRTIYQRHNENVSPRVQQEREMKLEALAYHTSRCSTEADAASRSRDSAPEHEQAAENRPVDGGSDRARQQLEAHFLHRAGKPGYRQPSIHLVMLAKAGDEAGIADTIDSLGQQIYPGWGLSIVSEETAPSDEFDRLPMLEWIQSSDPVEGFMQTLRTSQCEWIGWISPGDTLEPDALATFVDYVNLNPEWKFIYCDEDSVDGHGTQLEHRYKPDANPELLRSCPYIGNLSLVHRGMLPTRSVAAMEPEAVFYALALQVLETEGARALGHIPTLLFHRLHA